MQIFFTLLQKELSNCFRNGLAYWIFLIYLFVSIGSAFYFGSFLSMRDTALYALFLPQPIILTVLVPALTMRSWTSEYRLGTAEFLLTQPVSDTTLVAAKMLAVWLLFSLMSLFFLPFILYTATWLYLDFANLIMCWFGLELLTLMLVALGCLVSCLCRQLAVSYLCSVLSMALLTGLPLSGLYAAYKNFLFAEVGIADAAYFLLTSAALLILNIFALALHRNEQHNRIWRLGTFAVLLLIGVVFSIISLYYSLPNKTDFTTARVYSLKPQTVEIIKKLKKPITLDIFVANDYLKQNPDQQFFVEQIGRLMQKYQTQSQGMIDVRLKIVDAFSDEEENALQKGLYYETNSAGSRNYFGAVIYTDEAQTVIRQFLPQRQAFAEKDVDVALLKLMQPERQRIIGVYLDGKQNLDPFVSLFTDLENDYNILNIEDNTYHISDKLDLLLLVNPKKLPSVFKYAIDQYLMRGGKIILFFDFFSRSQNNEINKNIPDIIDFFADWGIDLQKDLYEKGSLAPMFVTGKHNLNIHSAASFSVSDKTLRVEPFISAEKGYIGAILKGKIRSHYDTNPFADNNPSLRLLPYTGINENAQIAIVGDVDLLDENNWVSPQSPDRNPYSIIATAANGQAVRALVDYMSNNDIYRTLPINAQASNEQNISEQMNEKAQAVYSRQISENKEELRRIRATLYQQSGGNEDKLRQMLQISSAGQELAKAEQQNENLSYLVKKAYLAQTRRSAIGQIFILPTLCIIVLWLFLKRRAKRRQKQLLEKIYE